MTKIVLSKLSPKELRESLAMSRNVVTETKRQIAAETKVISYKDMAANNRKKLGKQVDSLLKAFANYSAKVIKVGDKEVEITKLVTPEVAEGLLRPFKNFLETTFKADTIEEAVKGIREKMDKDIELYGHRRDGIIEDIKAYYNSKIDLYLKPLEVLEAQLNSFKPTAVQMKQLPSMGNRITKFLTTNAETIEEVPNPEFVELKDYAAARGISIEEAREEKKVKPGNTRGKRNKSLDKVSN